MPEREITAPVAIARDGRLNPDAPGWSRSALHTTTGLGRGRTKKWEHWGIVSESLILGLTLADLDYARLLGAYLLDRATGAETARSAILLRPSGLTLTAHTGHGVSRARGGGLELVFAERSDEAHLQLVSEDISADLHVAVVPGRDALGVLVPWNERRFQYSLKDVGRPARGTVTLAGATHVVDEPGAYAVLDHGRGKWPYRSAWTWAAAAGMVGGHDVGLNLGGGWTDGTGVTENGVLVDGVLHKVHGDLTGELDTEDRLRPWRIHGHGVDVSFIPVHGRVDTTWLGVIASSIHQCFGRFEGSVTVAGAGRVDVTGLFGWAETARHRW